MTTDRFTLKGNIVDLVAGRIFPGAITIDQGRIIAVQEESGPFDQFIIPGLVDSHVHIESSMLPPAEFARLATIHGTVAAVADPHEIANVLGMEGIDFMLASASQSPFNFHFGAPSCVPATPFETAGDEINADQIHALLADGRCHFLSEMMNFPGVLNDDAQVLAKIAVAAKLGKVVDGHAPGLTGDAAKRYIAAGISTDHECRDLSEAREKINLGMKILVREGSAARDFDHLWPLINDHAGMVMFCSDDKHPDDLLTGHINELVAKAIAKGCDPINTLKCACLNPVRHYGINLGLLQPGDRADCVVVESLSSMRVVQTFINGRLCAENGQPLLKEISTPPCNRFDARKVEIKDLEIRAGQGSLKVIEAMDGQLVTNLLALPATVDNGLAVSDPARDILKLAVINRYQPSLPSVAFIKGFGLKSGAIASSVAHDSHNIVAVGASDADLCLAVNSVIEAHGGICAANAGRTELLPLPIAGLMATADGYQTAQAYTKIDAMAKELGSTLKAPFMTLSFMALLVIPSLKMSDKGLFDSETFAFTSLFTGND